MQLYQPTITGSLLISGSIVATGGITVSGSIDSASFAASASNAVNAATASFVTLAQTASFVTTAQTASFVANAQSASNAVTAQTASYANALTVAGTLTAQTLVVQTITSSVNFVTGSTKFGSLSSNTHVFTGSMAITGGLVDINKDGQSLRIFPQTSSGSARIQLQNSGSAGLAGANAIIAVESVAGADQFSGTSPFSFVIGTATQKAFHLGTNSAVVMTITGSNVGIGTTNPHSLLEVYAGSGSVFRAVYNGVNSMEIGNYKPAGSGGGYQELCIASSQINLLTGTAGGGSATSRIFITQAGSVGIGTTNPSFILDVNDTNASGVRGVRISSSSSTVGPGLFLYINSGAQTNWAIGNSYEVGNALEFRSSNSVGGNPGSAGTTRMLIASGGNVGIGTNSPNGLLSLRASLSDTPILRFQNNITSGLDAALSTYVSSTQTYLTIGTNCYINSTGNIARFNTSYESSFIAFDEGTLRFSTGTTSANPVTKLNIAPSGKMTIDQSAYFVCGTTGFRFNNSTDAFNNFVALDNGNATLRGTLTQNSSDERLKNNIQIIPNAIDKINQLKGVTFEWNQELYETSRTTDIGVIAQDVQKVLPDAVTLAPFDTNFDDNTSKSGNNYLTVYYEKLIPLLIEGIKEQQAQIEELKARLT